MTSLLLLIHTSFGIQRENPDFSLSSDGSTYLLNLIQHPCDRANKALLLTLNMKERQEELVHELQTSRIPVFALYDKLGRDLYHVFEMPRKSW